MTMIENGVLKDNFNKMVSLKLFGRQRLYSDIEQNELNAENIALVLQDVLPKHEFNVRQIEYLRNVRKGNQDIYQRVKEVRPEIKNTVVENHILHATSFKKSYVFGYPIQYVQLTDDTIDNIPQGEVNDTNRGFDPDISKDIGLLNRYMRSNNKASKDLKMASDLYEVGVGVRFFKPTPSNKDVPFEIFNLKPEQSATVYSNGFKEERLFSFHIVDKTRYKGDDVKQDYKLITVYTDKHIFKYEYDTKTIQYIKPKKLLGEINPLGTNPIFEYELNPDRLSVTEVLLPAQNALNSLTSDELDDVAQFVQAMMVFLNADIDEDTLILAKQLGAISIKSSAGQPGNVSLLTSKLVHTETKVLYDRIQEISYTNIGVPLINVGSTGSHTGIARLTDNGWLMADTKAREDELAWIDCDRPMLETIIKYLKNRGLLSKLTMANIETKFTRNKSDNLLTKAQALRTMVGTVHPEDAYELSGLFSDSNEAVSNALDYYGKDFFKETAKIKAVDGDIKRSALQGEAKDDADDPNDVLKRQISANLG